MRSLEGTEGCCLLQGLDMPPRTGTRRDLLLSKPYLNVEGSEILLMPLRPAVGQRPWISKGPWRYAQRPADYTGVTADVVYLGFSKGLTPFPTILSWTSWHQAVRLGERLGHGLIAALRGC